jgi:phosphoglycolate phosphatase
MSYKLLVTDIDNTVFDWVNYYVHSFSALLEHVSTVIGVNKLVLAEESKNVFTSQGSIEYPFLIQQLQSVKKHYGDDIDTMLNVLVRDGRDRFLAVAENYLKPYDGVLKTLTKIRKDHPKLPIVALTDAPRYVAMWKLNKLGLLPFFDAVYGLADPRIPTCENTRRVLVDPEILLKHLQGSSFGFAGKIRVLPDEYEKPGTRGLKMVLMDYDIDEDKSHRSQVLWVGDNLRKDVGLGNRLGVHSVWAKYGADVDQKLLKDLATFSPTQNIHKNVSLPSDSPDSPKPVATIAKFSELVNLL